MDNRFDFKQKEEKMYKNWEKSGYFKARIDQNKKPFVISMPPPNVTAKLHLGHALVNAIQDVFIRYHRLKGEPSLWIPGTDHASIATEVKVIEKIKKEGKTKESLGREGFLEEAFEWKNKYGGEITEQLRKLGCSCDWEKERFTMDEGCSNAVLHVFETLYKKGLIYKGKRIVNWCPDCKTPISEIEVEYEEEESFLWYIKYPIENSDDFVVVATTRPETMLGDTGVAVNPSDERYTHIVGKRVLLPIVNRYIPIVADHYVEKDFGTGVVKMTPSHDPNDFEVGKRQNLEFLNILNDNGTLNENTGKYNGMSTIKARKKIEEELQLLGFLVKKEKHIHNVGSCYRCHTKIEPYISNQWFVKMEELAKPAIEAVKNEETCFVPKRFEKPYLNWMENIQDWCISRQLWWGHRIPAYYCDKCDEITVSKEIANTCKCGGKLKQDEDTLDTWFSSALWPFSILGWPTKTKEYEYFYPNSLLVTGYDIITFWVSKMIFSGLEYTGKTPFKHVFINGLVRDSQGRKMSKSLGNGVDPIDVINEYGTDALRLSLIQNISPGNDVRYIPEKVESSRNFVNKIWNATRFVNSYLENSNISSTPTNEQFKPADKWILTKMTNVKKEVSENIDKFEIGIALQKIYDFAWSDFCDWYIEIVKSRLYNSDDSESYNTALWTLNTVLIEIIKMLHPYIPFVTEEIYSNLFKTKESIMLEEWDIQKYNFHIVTDITEVFLNMIRSIRNERSNANIAPAKKINIQVYIKDKVVFDTYKICEDYIKKLSGIEEISYLDSENNANQTYTIIALPQISIYLDLLGSVDIESEIVKLKKNRDVALKELNRAKGIISNESFITKAPDILIQKEKEKILKYEDIITKINERLEVIK